MLCNTLSYPSRHVNRTPGIIYSTLYMSRGMFLGGKGKDCVMEHKSNAVKTVYFVRHGQSEANVAPEFQSPDSPLTQLGWTQAISLAVRAKGLPARALIASPFTRARQTAEEISDSMKLSIEFNDLFVERKKPTSIYGKPYTDTAAHDTWRRWEESLRVSGLRVEDGENFDDLLARADAALEYLLARPESSIVVVTHGFFLRTVILRMLLGDLLTDAVFRVAHPAMALANTGITVAQHRDGFEEEARWRLWTFNDHAHLGGV